MNGEFTKDLVINTQMFIKAGDIWSSLNVMVVFSRHDGWLVRCC